MRLPLNSRFNQPVVEQLDRRAFERARAAHEPIAIGAVDVEIEQPHQAVIMRILEMVAMHEGDADALRRRFEHQRAAVEMVDAVRFQPLHADGTEPFGESVGHFAVDQHRHPLQLLGNADPV